MVGKVFTELLRYSFVWLVFEGIAFARRKTVSCYKIRRKKKRGGRFILAVESQWFCDSEGTVKDESDICAGYKQYRTMITNFQCVTTLSE